METQLGEFSLARSYYTESLTIRQQLAGRGDIAYSLDGIGALEAAQGKWYRAAKLFGAAEVLREIVHFALSAADLLEHDRIVALTRSELGDEGFSRAFLLGKAMDLEQAIRFAQDDCISGADQLEQVEWVSSEQPRLSSSVAVGAGHSKDS